MVVALSGKQQRVVTGRLNPTLAELSAPGDLDSGPADGLLVWCDDDDVEVAEHGGESAPAISSEDAPL